MHRFQTLRYSIYFPLINAVVKSNVAFFTLLFAGNLYVSKIRTSTQVLCERKLTEIFSRSVATVSANRLLQLLSHHRHILRVCHFCPSFKDQRCIFRVVLGANVVARLCFLASHLCLLHKNSLVSTSFQKNDHYLCVTINSEI